MPSGGIQRGHGLTWPQRRLARSTPTPFLSLADLPREARAIFDICSLDRNATIYLLARKAQE